LDRERIALSIAKLARLGRQRDFSFARFHKSLDGIARPEEKAEVLRRLLTDWTGLPHGAREARERWEAVEKVALQLKKALGAPVSLQTAVLHYFHSVQGMLREPRIVSEKDLSVLRVNAITDPLTGLYNRRFLLDHLNREIARAERNEGIVSIVLLDLKGFKAVNDHFGHPVGDTVLVKTARIIRDLLLGERPDDGILGEEGSQSRSDSGRTWIVDPLDGTVNFLYGLRTWAVSIALEDEEGLAAGAVVGAGCILEKVVVDCDAVIPSNTMVGAKLGAADSGYYVSPEGIVLATSARPAQPSPTARWSDRRRRC